MKKLYSLILVSIFFVTGCQTSSNENINVSMISLIANPEKYDNKMVTVIGVGNLEFEGNKVCLSKNDLDYHISGNCFWLELSEETPYEEAKNLNGKYVIIEGTFDVKNKGHFGRYSGTITNITRYENWE